MTNLKLHTFLNHAECPRADKGEGVKKSNILPDVLSEWPPTVSVNQSATLANSWWCSISRIEDEK